MSVFVSSLRVRAYAKEHALFFRPNAVPAAKAKGQDALRALLTLTAQPDDGEVGQATTYVQPPLCCANRGQITHSLTHVPVDVCAVRSSVVGTADVRVPCSCWLTIHPSVRPSRLVRCGVDFVLLRSSFAWFYCLLGHERRQCSKRRAVVQGTSQSTRPFFWLLFCRFVSRWCACLQTLFNRKIVCLLGTLWRMYVCM